jgi:hypothetical protein
MADGRIAFRPKRTDEPRSVDGLRHQRIQVRLATRERMSDVFILQAEDSRRRVETAGSRRSGGRILSLLVGPAYWNRGKSGGRRSSGSWNAAKCVIVVWSKRSVGPDAGTVVR